MTETVSGGFAMKTLGLDIGTTSISAVVFEAETGVLAARTIKNDTFLESRPWERIQDPLKIQKAAVSLVEELAAAFPDVSAIGVTGQMHGILYLNSQGKPVSPLYI
jgi:sedoheptulokinase